MTAAYADEAGPARYDRRMARGVQLEQVASFADGLPGVAIGARWDNRTWLVGDHGFAWQRPLSKADVKRFGDEALPQGELLAVITDGLDGKDALLAMELPGFFTIPHFNGFPAVLIELARARLADVRAAIADAHRIAAARPPKKPKPARKSKAKPRPAVKRTRRS
jgi:hypothetical protein